jgi:ABC-type branched-subunit amino acid transport system substrate-binding protein
MVLSLTGCQKKESEKKFKIGVLTPLSGDLASLGEDMRAAFLLAQEESQSKAFQTELIFEDTAFNPAKTVLAAKKLLEVDKVDLIISGGGECGKIVSPLAQQKKIVNFILGSKFIDSPKSPYDFYHFSPPSNFLKQFVYELDQRKVQTVSIMAIHHPVVDEYIMRIKDVLGESRVKSIEYVSPQERDFRMTLSKIKSQNPQALVVFFTPPQLDLLGRQANEMKLNIPLTTWECFDQSKEPKWFEGCWYINVPETDSGFSARVEKKGGSKGYIAGYSYDIYRIIEMAYENKGSQPLEESLRQMKPYTGIMGDLTMMADGVIDSPSITKEIKDGKGITVRGFLGKN